MAADKFNLYIEQGADFSLEFLWKDSAGAAVNLTGYTIRMQVREKVDTATTLVDIDSSSLPAGITVGPLNSTGQVDIDIANAVTSTYDWPDGVYDLIAVSSGGIITRLMEGRATVSRAVTR